MKNIFIMSLFSLVILAPVMASDNDQLPNAEGGDKSPRHSVVEKGDDEEKNEGDGLTQVSLSGGGKDGENQNTVPDTTDANTDPAKSDKKNKCNIQ